MASKRWKAKPFKLPPMPNRIASTAIKNLRARGLVRTTEDRKVIFSV
uniref:Uncharacterized protein n=1 Tax=Onchocerca volvulus TaxID=6282 RepID=A0A8R1XR41_ONCVO